MTSPVLTLIDLATRLSSHRLEAAINAADKLDLVGPERLREALRERSGARGVPALRALLDRHTVLATDSELERQFLRLIAGAALPRPETGVRVNGYRVDFYWRDLGLIVETDGLRYHRTPASQTRDRKRDQEHTARGITILRFTHAQVNHESPRVIQTLTSVIGRLTDDCARADARLNQTAPPQLRVRGA